MEQYGIYIHIPFCQQKCFYCDFPSFAGREQYIDSYLAAMDREFLLVKKRLLTEQREKQARFQPRTLYIGGGTPSSLSSEQLVLLGDIIQRHIDLAKAQEITVEMNPHSAVAEKLHIFKAMGVNRLSIGVQSFDDGCLAKIGRCHRRQEAVACVAAAKKLGFANISLDLMYGLPGQTLSMLQESVEMALSLGVQHISVYGLQVEEGTVFGKWQEQGRLQLPDEAETEAMYDYLVKALPEAGYHRYEISNFALPGYASQHNLSYWQDIFYLGFGSGAHSYWQNRRYENPADIKEYMEAIHGGKVMEQLEEKVTPQAHMEEYCFLGLRMAQGIARETFQQKFHCTMDSVYGKVIAKLKAQGLLQEKEGKIFLTEQGMKFGNQVFAEFLL